MKQDICGQTVIGLEVRDPVFTSDKDWRFDEIVFHLEASTLVLGVNIDTDEISLVIRDRDESGSAREGPGPLRDVIGRKVGWLWLCKNSQGFTDMAMMSFDGISPEIGFIVAASSIRILSIREAR